ncbi:family 20 glycosylhydrolase [Pedobacter sp. BS3]|nr:family 20 glycosylhydrolase [Pedobacter sp. BS3]
MMAHAQSNDLSIIPQPQHLKENAGEFRINSATKIVYDKTTPGLADIAADLAANLKSRLGYPVKVTNVINAGVGANIIVLTAKNAIDTLGNEGYTLSVDRNQITVRAPKANGIFYGVETIYQLLPVMKKGETVKSLAVPAVEITDKPRFGWRGAMLDVGRYFYPVDFIKKYIDYLAMHKMNVFHWHLTEDHGWRIEIKKYPRLTSVGAWRTGTQVSHSPVVIDSTANGGFYTQEQIKDVVAYAQKRYITVVPEIEMPGHSLAALVAYPELSCTGGPFKMPVAWGIQKDIYCAGNEQTFKFLEDVLTEVVALFPSPYIHIGGDEAPKDRWKACPKCQARIKAEGLKDEHELQSYFIKRIEDFLLTKNKRIIGWDEILEGGLAPNATVMSWRGVKGGIAAAKQHHDVIMTPNTTLYLDYYQGEPSLEPVAIGKRVTTLEKVYQYEPVPAELSPEEAKYIKGLQANIWGEYIHKPYQAEYMTMPRLSAAAEVAWTQPNLKNWEDFKRRMEKQYDRYASMNINYAKSAYNVWPTVTADKAAKKATVTLTTDSYQPQIYYTLDGSEPTTASLKYTQPFEVTGPVTIKAANFRNNEKLSKVTIKQVNP